MVTADAVVYRVEDGAIQLLLIQRGREPFIGEWAFPGGFVEMDEELTDTASRELIEETGVGGIELEQMRAFGAVGRDPRGRMITVTYMGKAPAGTQATAGDDAADARWFDIDKLPTLAFDHDRVVRIAIDKIAQRENMQR